MKNTPEYKAKTLTRNQYLLLPLADFLDYIYNSTLSDLDIHNYISENAKASIIRLNLMLDEVNIHLRNRQVDYITQKIDESYSTGEAPPVIPGKTIEDKINYLKKTNFFKALSVEQQELKIIEIKKNRPYPVQFIDEDKYEIDPQVKPLQLFRNLILTEIEFIENSCPISPPMNWKGQNNVLTDVFREMRNKEYLTNSIPDVAKFLKANFDCFSDTKLSTLETMLKNNNSSANARPKEEKRINIE